MLFLLLQKKFRDLGEFVEGKEKLNIVFHRSYRDEQQAIESICIPDVSKHSQDIDDESVESDDQNFTNLAEDESVKHDFEELAIEEMATVRNGEEDEDESPESSSSSKISSGNLARQLVQNGASRQIGSTQHHAICLSDDEDEIAFEPECMNELCNHYEENQGWILKISRNLKCPDTLVYYMYFCGPKYGFLVTYFQGRIVISTNNASGGNSFSSGDFIIGINDVNFNLYRKNCFEIMRRAITNSPVRLIIGRNKDFTNLFEEFTKRNHKSEPPVPSQAHVQQKPSSAVNDVIEVLD